MKVIRPITITPDKILSSTVIEIYSNWSSSTTYALGTKVIYQNRIYESLIASNLNKQPNTNPTSWLDIAPSNKTAMFDNLVNTQTTATTSFTTIFQPGTAFNAITFLNLKGISISVVVKDYPGGNTVYSETKRLDATVIQDWYAYFFEDFDVRTEVIFSDIPPYVNGVVEVTIMAGTGSEVAIGGAVVGSLIEIGLTQYGLGYGIRDYSIKETDEFGNTRFLERAFSKRMSPSIFVKNNRLNYVTKNLEKLRATPAVFIATDDNRFEGTIVFGFLKDWNIEVSYPEHSMLSAEIEGLI